jgi:glutaredoxin 3
MPKTTIYSKPKCPYCDKAKKLLTDLNKRFDVVTLGVDIKDRDVFIRTIEDIAGQPVMTVPQVVFEGQYIGGFTQLAKHFNIDPDSVKLEN